MLCIVSPRPVEETMTEKTENLVKAAALTKVEASMSVTACAVALITKYLAAMSAAERVVVENTARSLTIE